MALVSLTIFVNQVLIKEISSIIYPTIVGVSQITYPYFEGLVLFLFNILILLVIVIFLNMTLVYTLGDSVLRRMVPLLRSSVNNRRVGRDVTNVYYLDFLIGVFFNKIALFSVLQTYSIFKALYFLGVPFIIRPSLPFSAVFLSLDSIQIYGVPSFSDGFLLPLSGGIRFHKSPPPLCLL